MSWVARGNQAADEHWRPAGDVCAMCSMNLSFIAHSEHYGEDAQVSFQVQRQLINVFVDFGRAFEYSQVVFAR